MWMFLSSFITFPSCTAAAVKSVWLQPGDLLSHAPPVSCLGVSNGKFRCSEYDVKFKYSEFDESANYFLNEVTVKLVSMMQLIECPFKLLTLVLSSCPPWKKLLLSPCFGFFFFKIFMAFPWLFQCCGHFILTFLVLFLKFVGLLSVFLFLFPNVCH